MTQTSHSGTAAHETTWADTPVTIPVGVLVRAYGALGACANHLRNFPGTSEGDDLRIAKLAQDAFDAIEASVLLPETSE